MLFVNDRHFGITEDDREDIEQELTLDLIERWQKFDAERSKPRRIDQEYFELAEDVDSVLRRLPADEYHGKSKDYLSSHQLTDFRKCPLLYHRKRIGLIPDEDRPAYVVGRAAHTLILEGRQRFDGVAEAVVRAEYCGVNCQIRMDWFDPQRGIIDLKTCDDLTWFEADARRYGYVHQVSFYRAVLAQAIGTGERIVRTAERPAHVAKNRLNLPDELPLDWDEYAKFFTHQPSSNGEKKHG